MQSVFCIATSARLADRMLERLRDAEVPSSDVSVLVPTRLAHDHRLEAWWTPLDELGEDVLESSLTWLSTVREVTLADIGQAVAVGPVGGMLEPTDGPTALAQVLLALGLADFEARRYVAELCAGRILMAVHTPHRDQIQRSEQVFEQCAGEDIATAVRVRAA